MSIKRYGSVLIPLLLVMLGVVTVTAQPDWFPRLAPMGTAFTYQGYLEDGGNPANGSYNLRFSLWDAASGGAQIGGAQTKIGVSVADGLFQVSLDFGAVYDGTSFWLAIQVQKPGDPGYTTLDPRQPITPVPYALNADAVGGHQFGTHTGYLSIPAAAFQCTQYDSRCDTIGSEILVYADSISPFIVAPVSLPDGAVVTSVTFYWTDSHVSNNGDISMRRLAMSDGSWVEMTHASTTGSGGYGFSTNSTINYSLIDNSQYGYYIRGRLTGDYLMKLHLVLIEYTYQGLE
jgi:hypothetical protein